LVLMEMNRVLQFPSRVDAGRSRSWNHPRGSRPFPRASCEEHRVRRDALQTGGVGRKELSSLPPMRNHGLGKNCGAGRCRLIDELPRIDRTCEERVSVADPITSVVGVARYPTCFLFTIDDENVSSD